VCCHPPPTLSKSLFLSWVPSRSIFPRRNALRRSRLASHPPPRWGFLEPVSLLFLLLVFFSISSFLVSEQSQAFMALSKLLGVLDHLGRVTLRTPPKTSFLSAGRTPLPKVWGPFPLIRPVRIAPSRRLFSLIPSYTTEDQEVREACLFCLFCRLSLGEC